ncbi:MAG TPA: hypothetical protein RMH85_29950 [Polyangiaceae bacterium LLY-WYZ-15_(1-7)]|nr:hypothetical protein [Polyangiaceae bacterium LLY-WYZ-15_(1-7)]HJL12743.1 hypothetical protein [Polyangiaceae bacterium LLY-WYZ-15_(1-7)]HJL50892.1 hypothetical protein [Polyangiaceae bacterium LLY-WYZ-15_(1-7)]
MRRLALLALAGLLLPLAASAQPPNEGADALAPPPAEAEAPDGSAPAETPAPAEDEPAAPPSASTGAPGSTPTDEGTAAPAPASPASSPASASGGASEPSGPAGVPVAPPGYGPPSATPVVPPSPVVRPGPTTPTYGPPAPQTPRRVRTHVTPYEEGQPIPEDAELHESRRLGMLIPGAVMFGVSYISLVAGWSDSIDAPAVLLVPLAGPFLGLRDFDDSITRAALVVDGLLQVAGLTLFALGLRKRKTLHHFRMVLGEGRSLTLAPTAGPRGAGARAALTF